MNVKRWIQVLSAVAMVCAAGCSFSRQSYAGNEPARKMRMKQFNEEKFGMFIHWGLYAVPAGQWNGQTNYGEWIMLQGKITSQEYEKFASRFNPVQFNAKEWVSIANAAGMNYLVITAKHHDGFCMYDSKQ